MSSHREAPEISKDPNADNTDVYAFVSPDNAGTVTLIANYIPFQAPDGGPNFFEFADDVLYEIHVANSGTSDSDITYQFRFKTQIRNPDTFLYNTGPISSPTDTNWNRPQTYSVTKVTAAGTQVLATGLSVPPCNVGVRSTPNYAAIAAQAVHGGLPNGETVFAGQRADGFYVDVGSIFDLGTLRPFENLHLIKTAAANGVNSLGNSNVHSIAMQIPKSQLTGAAGDVIGVWASASRRAVQIRDQRLGRNLEFGRFEQVSRLGNPLFNEVIVPMSRKDMWNAGRPTSDAGFVQNVRHPELAGLLVALYPGVFPNLAALNASGAARDDLAAILLSGIPAGAISALPPAFTNFIGPAPADMLRLNTAQPPTPMASADIRGVLGGDLAGFPNGRRVFDDITTIELRAVAGVTYQLLHPSYTADGAAAIITQYNSTMNPASGPLTPSPSVDNKGNPTVDANGKPIGTIPIPPVGFYLSSFPYLGTPYDGYSYPFEPNS